MRYPIGIQSFEEIRTRDYVYLDKTHLIYNIIDRGKYYFLSRPRRFGKSLLLSTIEELFKGRRDLFKGLAIDSLQWEWISYPVLHLDFTGRNYSNPDALESHLDEMLSVWENKYGIAATDAAPEERFRKIILNAREQSGHGVVILIDEYDKPLLETVEDPELQTKYKNVLRAVYGNLKKLDSQIQFAMLTGVTKFGHLSIFSDLNNLNDISLDKEYSGICGITSTELNTYFQESIEDFAEANSISAKEAYEELKLYYDGYHFSPKGAEDIYNPFSLLCALSKSEIGEYWFSTGTPTFLTKLIKSRRLPLQILDDIKISQAEVENVSLDLKTTLIPMLYQTGYLTIKGFIPRMRILELGFPNREVENGFMMNLMKLYLVQSEEDPAISIFRFSEDVMNGKAESFMQRLQSMLADINYESIDKISIEQHFQDVTYMLFKLLGLQVSTEYQTSNGRIDMVIKTQRFVYVIEFKIDKSAEEALRQIDSKGYMIPFKSDGKHLIKIGANFSSKDRRLNEWIIEEES